jgi:hypothetical protein
MTNPLSFPLTLLELEIVSEIEGAIEVAEDNATSGEPDDLSELERLTAMKDRLYSKEPTITEDDAQWLAEFLEDSSDDHPRARANLILALRDL